MEKTAFLKKNYHIIILALFLSIQLVILSNITFYGDDYYYMTFTGDGIKNFFDLNVTHYKEVNGRSIVHLLCELLLADRTLILFRVFCLAVCGSTVFLTSYIACGYDVKSKYFPSVLCISCVLFSVINIGTANQSIYWVTGALNYFFPVPLTLFYFCIYGKLKKGQPLPKWTPVVAFFASALIEQLAFASLIITGLIIYTTVSNRKKADISTILTAIASIVGFSLLFFAPGNSVRQTFYSEFYSMPLYKRIISNIKPLFSLIFSKAGGADVITVYLASCAVISFLRKKKIHLAVAFFNLCAALLVAVHAHITNNSVLAVLAAVLTVISFLFNILILILTLDKRDPSRLYFTIVALILQAAMLVSPVYGPRTLLCSEIMLFVPTAKNFIEIRKCASSISAVLKRETLISAISSAVAVAAVVLLTVPTAVGYIKNNNIQKYNMQNVAQCLENSETDLTIYYLPERNFKYTMPYDSTYHEYWFCEAFGIGHDVNITYAEYKK